MSSFDHVADSIPVQDSSSSSSSQPSSPAASSNGNPSSSHCSTPVPTSPIDPKNVKKVSKQSTTKRRPRTSHIWNYSTTNPDDGITLNRDGQEVWICSMCKDRKTTYLLSGGTAAPIRHLARVHKIEPCISHSRPRRSHHAKHHSESSIILSSSANAALYKNDLYQQNFGNPFMPPGMVNGLGHHMQTMVPLIPQQMMAPNHVHPMQQGANSDMEKQYVFPMVIGNGHDDMNVNYSVPTTPMNPEFIQAGSYGYPISSMGHIPGSQYGTQMSSVAHHTIPETQESQHTSHNPAPNNASAIRDPSDSVESVKGRMAPSTSTLNSQTSIQPSERAQGSESPNVSSTPRTNISSNNSSSASAAPSPITPLASYASAVSPQKTQKHEMEVNLEGAFKALVEIVSQYNVPSTLFDSESFKNFCVSLNPSAADALPVLKSKLKHSKPSPSEDSRETPENTQQNFSGNYSYSNSNSGTNNELSNAANMNENSSVVYYNDAGNIQAAWAPPFTSTSGMNETLVAPPSQTYQGGFIW